MKYVIALVLGLVVSSVYATDCHVQQVQAVVQHHNQRVVQFVEVPHVQRVFVQPVRQQVVVERVVNNHHNNVQAVVVKQQVVRQKVVVADQRQNVQVRVGGRNRANVQVRIR